MYKVSPKTKKTTFQIKVSEANSVCLLGDFNGWNAESNPMKQSKNGVWKIDLKLSEGEYEFRYLVNHHEWLNDDKALKVDNMFGGENSVATISYQ